MPPDTSPGSALAAVFGIVVGVVIRFAVVDTWPQPVPAFASTLIVAAIGGCLIGYLRRGGPRADDPWRRAAVLGAVSATTSSSLIALLAVSSSPALCAAYVVCCPIVIAAGAVCGALVHGVGPGAEHDVERGARGRTARH